MIVMHFDMQGEDIIKHTNSNVSCVYILVCKRKIFFSILMPSIICVHVTQHVCRPLCNIDIHLVTLLSIVM